MPKARLEQGPPNGVANPLEVLVSHWSKVTAATRPICLAQNIRWNSWNMFKRDQESIKRSKTLM